VSALPTVVTVASSVTVRGGAEKVATDTAVLLARAGYDSVLFAGAGEPSEELRNEPNLRLVVADETPGLRKLARMREEAWSRRSRQAMATLLDGLDPQRTVVHVHTFREHVTASALQEVFERELPVVMTVHDYALGCPAVGFYDVRRQRICPLRGGSMACLATNCIDDRYRRKLEIGYRYHLWANKVRLGQRVSALVYLSELSRNVLQSYVEPSVPSFFVPNPVEAVDEGPRSWSPDRPFVFLARLEPAKGPRLLADAAARVGAPVVFVGDGPEAEAVRRMYPAAQITGWAERDEVQRRLRDARALVFPSRWYEGQPLAIQEALALGVPVIVSDACAGREAVVNGETGLWFRSGNPEDLAEKLRTLMDDATAQQMGFAAHRRWWSDPPTPARYVARIGAVYRDVLAG
jgi:glycosyltransferase involved in cell wall biosynthesis